MIGTVGTTSGSGRELSLGGVDVLSPGRLRMTAGASADRPTEGVASFQAALKAAEARSSGMGSTGGGGEAVAGMSGGDAGGDDPVRELAAQFVAAALVKPVFDMMRNDPMKSELFHGGFAEDVFAQQLHGIYRERLVASERLDVVDAIVAKIRQGASSRLGRDVAGGGAEDERDGSGTDGRMKPGPGHGGVGRDGLDAGEFDLRQAISGLGGAA